MDAHAHLISLGWAGPGHSLDSRPSLPHKGRRGLAYDPSQTNNTGRGLVKPLLVSQKKNAFGVGKKIHEPAAGNEWWLKGFETALSNIGKQAGSKATSGTATLASPSASASASTKASGYRGKHAGLYGCFVKGQQMEGTIGEEDAKKLRGRKRKSDTFDEGKFSSTSSETPSSDAFSARKSSKLKVETALEFQQISQFLNVRDKERRRPDTSVDLDPAQEFEQMSHFFEARSEHKKKKKKKHQTMQTDDSSSAVVAEGEKIFDQDSSEEKRQQRKAARAEKVLEATSVTEKEMKKKREERRAAKVITAAAASSSEKENAWSCLSEGKPVCSPETVGRAPADEALRKAERKKRKEERRLAKLQAGS